MELFTVANKLYLHKQTAVSIHLMLYNIVAATLLLHKVAIVTCITGCCVLASYSELLQYWKQICKQNLLAIAKIQSNFKV